MLRSAHLRRLLIAYSLFSVAEFAVWIAMLVYAFQQGGTTEASAVAVAQLVPAAILAAGAGAIAASHGVARTLTFGYLLQALGMAVCGATILLDGSKFLAYVAAIVAASAVTLTRPCQAAITPSLVPGAESLQADLQDIANCRAAVRGASDVFQLAADMGGMGFIEHNKALCMLSVLTNTHMLMAAREAGVARFFFSSSACVYNADKQLSPDVIALREEDAYPAMPTGVTPRSMCIAAT